MRNVSPFKLPWLGAFPPHVPVPGLVAGGQMQRGCGTLLWQEGAQVTLHQSCVVNP